MTVLYYLKYAIISICRIELCSSLAEGGLTPSLGFFRQVKKVNSRVPVNVLIRPRGGDFYYTQNEVEIMKEDANLFIENGAQGLVLGT